MSVKQKLKAKRKVHPVEVDGDTFHVRALTLGELEQIDQAATATDPVARKVEFGRALFALAVCDETGAAVFTGPADEDLDAIATDTMRVILDRAAEVNGMAPEQEGERGNG